jgi:hypothetical protein
MTKKLSPFDFVNAINSKKDYDLIETDEDRYAPFIVNRAFSFFPDTIHFCNEMNKYGSGIIDGKQQFDFYYHGLPKQKRWSGGKWKKDGSSSVDQSSLEFIKTHILKVSDGWSDQKILDVIDLFPDDYIEKQQQKHETGGMKK